MDNNPNVAKHRMEQTLRITGFIDRIATKIMSINQCIEVSPAIMTRIDYHKMVSRKILLGNEWRELINEWHTLQIRGATSHMHGMNSIISRTQHRVTDALKKSNQVLQTAIENDPTVTDGGPPGGIPVIPAATIKPSLTLKPGEVRKKRDCFEIEVITIDDESTESE